MNKKLMLLSALNDLNILPQLFKEGLIYSKVQCRFEIYMQVQAEMRVNGNKKTLAVSSVSFKMGIEKDTVWKALASFKK